MREILFRGKQAWNDEWAESEYPFGTIHCGAIVHDFIPETVGQYTGLTDKNGNKIFEGDIVKARDYLLTSPFCDGIIGKIVYDECAFFIEPTNPMDSQWMYNECAEYEIIGNIHDNPELLKGE